MNKNLVLAGALAAALCMPLAACGGSGTPAATDGGSSAGASASASNSADVNALYVGQWRGSVEITGQTVYGTAGGNEQMLDVLFNEDGTVNVKPLEAHADLLTEDGTWEGTDSSVTLHLSSGDITLTVVDSATLTGNAADFGIADFDTINFDFYG